ncbi:MAG: phospholipase [Candidatus Dormibacteraeota bacterium]|nr:phospholipase [Candidatus Dormibacteraeota bacterium]
MTAALPRRNGPKPATSLGMPHQQLDQQPEDSSPRDALAQRVFALPGVVEERSGVSVPGARALVLEPDSARGPATSFMVGREFAHLHPAPDESLHIVLPYDVATAAIDAGWAEPHPLAARMHGPSMAVMVFAPRNDEEVGVVAGLVETSYREATGAGELASG